MLLRPKASGLRTQGQLASLVDGRGRRKLASQLQAFRQEEFLVTEEKGEALSVPAFS